MRKFFSFQSSASSNLINDRAPPPVPLDNEEVHWEAPFTFGDKNKTLKQIPERQILAPCLSFSSASSIGSPGNNRNIHAQSDDISVGCRSLTPDRQSKAKRDEGVAARKRYGTEKVEFPGSSNSVDSTCDAARGSPQTDSARLVHVSNNVLDLYIDGEQKKDLNLTTRSSSFRCQSNSRVSGRRPPRIQTTSPVSPTDMSKGEGRSQSLRDDHLMLSTREWKRTEFRSESPQKLARNVVERLSQVFPHKLKTRSRDLDPDTPTTVEDIFESFVDRNPSSYSDVITQKNCVSDIPYGAMTGYDGEGGKDFPDERFCVADAPVCMYKVKEGVDLRKYADEAQERVMFISEEIEQDSLLRSRDFNVSESFQTIRGLRGEKRSLAVEVLTQVQCRNKQIQKVSGMIQSLACLLLLCLLVLPLVSALTNPQEVEVLQAMYASLNLNTLGDPCKDSWKGIICSESSVVSIELAGQNLNGTLGGNLFGLQNLKRLDLSYNNIEGAIPLSLPPNATHIDLSSNRFKQNGTLSLNPMKFLEYLNISRNSLSCQLGDVFMEFPSLRKMDLSNNEFTGALPVSFSELRNLTSLFLQRNRFKGPVALLEHLPLKDLWIQLNEFSGPIPQSFWNITNLRVDRNYFRDDVPHVLGFGGEEDGGDGKINPNKKNGTEKIFYGFLWGFGAFVVVCGGGVVIWYCCWYKKKSASRSKCN